MGGAEGFDDCRWHNVVGLGVFNSHNVVGLLVKRALGRAEYLMVGAKAGAKVGLIDGTRVGFKVDTRVGSIEGLGVNEGLSGTEGT